MKKDNIFEFLIKKQKWLEEPCCPECGDTLEIDNVKGALLFFCCACDVIMYRYDEDTWKERFSGKFRPLTDYNTLVSFEAWRRKYVEE